MIAHTDHSITVQLQPVFTVSSVCLAVQPNKNADSQAIIKLTLTSNLMDTIEVDCVTASVVCLSTLPKSSKAGNRSMTSTGFFSQSTRQRFHSLHLVGTDSQRR